MAILTKPELLAWLETHCVVCEAVLPPCDCGKVHERSCYELGDRAGCLARLQAAHPEIPSSAWGWDNVHFT